MGNITLHKGDITTDAEADAIVNAANTSLRGGGGVDKAIHNAAGPALDMECSQITDGCKTGDAKITGAGKLTRINGAGNLAMLHVIHAVGPVWIDGSKGEPDLLAATYGRSIELADEAGDTRIAFPAISAGAFGYPVADAATVAIAATRAALAAHPRVQEARFWLYDDGTYDAFDTALNAAP